MSTRWKSDELGLDSSDEEEGGSSEGMSRVQKQALKREIPWKSIEASDWPAFQKSIADEWAEWQKWSSCKPVSPNRTSSIAKELILPSRVCYRWKPVDGGASYKPEARIVIQGFRDPHLPLLSRDAPVLARISLMVIPQWAATWNTDLWNGDMKSAFLQGLADTERPTSIFMRPPSDGVSISVIKDWTWGVLYELSAPVHGQANAPRR